MKRSYCFLVLMLSIMITSCGSSESAVKVDPYVGAWNLMIENTPQGNVSATMTITKNTEGVYAGKVNSDVGAFNLNELVINDGKLSSGFVIQDIEFDLMGTFEDMLFKGYVSGMGEDYQANGKKVLE